MLEKKAVDIVEQSMNQAKEHLVDLCAKIIEDGVVERHEVDELQQWLDEHAAMLETFPGNVISARLANHLADDHLDQREAGNMLRLLQRVVELEKGPAAPAPGTPLYDTPSPQLTFEGHAFAAIGISATGGPELLQHYATAKGGSPIDRVTGETPSVLVVGYFLGQQWMHGQCANEDRAALQEAIELRAAGKPVVIISEEHFISQLRRQ